VTIHKSRITTQPQIEALIDLAITMPWDHGPAIALLDTSRTASLSYPYRGATVDVIQVRIGGDIVGSAERKAVA
jgi:hypothetical protein